MLVLKYPMWFNFLSKASPCEASLWFSKSEWRNFYSLSFKLAYFGANRLLGCSRLFKTELYTVKWQTPSMAPLRQTKLSLSIIFSGCALTSYFFWFCKFFKNNGYIITYANIPANAPFTKEFLTGPYSSKTSNILILIDIPIAS